MIALHHQVDLLRWARLAEDFAGLEVLPLVALSGIGLGVSVKRLGWQWEILWVQQTVVM